MNGDTGENRLYGGSGPSQGGTTNSSVGGGTALSNYRAGAGFPAPSAYSSSPRLRRLDDMKKSYLSGSALPSSGGSYGAKYGTGNSASSSYRLASLDRLSHRQKLYETNGTDGSANGTITNNDADAVDCSASSNPSATSPSNANNTNNACVSVIATTRDITAPSQQPNSTGSSLTTFGPSTPPSVLQSKREMFFKSDSAGGGVGAVPPASLTHPSTAPPAPPTVNANSAPAAPTPAAAPPSSSSSTPHHHHHHQTSSITTTANNSPAAVNNTAAPPASVASIKEQLLTTKDKKDAKEEENKENKLVKERRPREVDGYVGFANLPNQVYRKAVKKGFEFSLMVVGESGLGKSTLINSLFLSDVYSADHPGPSHRVKKTVQVETTKVLLKENGVNLMLTIVDTPGFGDAVDNSDCWQPIIDYIENKYEQYLNAESQVNRTQINDNRIHCCLYFIGAASHGLKPLDIEFMKNLHDKVNIIPVIAKADTLTPDECQQLKKQILNEIAQNKIKIYEFPDEETDASLAKMRQKVPFAVVGSTTTIEVDGRKVRGRKYPWGIVEVENLEHCDFIPLRNLMIRTHMQDLKDVSNNVHYENYRCRKLAGIGVVDGKAKLSNKNPLAQMEEEKKEHSNRMRKMEAEMEQVFEMKVKEKMNKLQELEADLQKRNETMRRKLESDLNELKEERERYEREKKAWEAANNVTLEELRRKSLESLSREHVDGKLGKKKKGLF